jgi:SulP family sulfate permease
LGLAWLLFKTAWTLVQKAPETWSSGLPLLGQRVGWQWILVGGAVGTLALVLTRHRDLAALGVVIFGISISVLNVGLPPLSLSPALPKMLPLVPTWEQLLQGLWLLAVPQIPLSLGNSIYATADAAREYFEKKAAMLLSVSSCLVWVRLMQ